MQSLLANILQLLQLPLAPRVSWTSGLGKKPDYEHFLLCLIPIQECVNIAKVIAQWGDVAFEPHVIGIVSGECVGNLLPIVADNVGTKTSLNTHNTSSITFIDQGNTWLNCSSHDVLNCKRKESLKEYWKTRLYHICW